MAPNHNVQPIQRYIIIGPQNCGKSSLAQALARADPGFTVYDEILPNEDISGAWICVFSNESIIPRNLLMIATNLFIFIEQSDCIFRSIALNGHEEIFADIVSIS